MEYVTCYGCFDLVVTQRENADGVIDGWRGGLQRPVIYVSLVLSSPFSRTQGVGTDGALGGPSVSPPLAEHGRWMCHGNDLIIIHDVLLSWDVVAGGVVGVVLYATIASHRE